MSDTTERNWLNSAQGSIVCIEECAAFAVEDFNREQNTSVVCAVLKSGVKVNLFGPLKTYECQEWLDAWIQDALHKIKMQRR